MRKKILTLSLFSALCLFAAAQIRPDSIGLFDPEKIITIDTALRIQNLNPFFSLHVDSTLNYKLQINKKPVNYYWYLKNAPVGLRIDKDNGTISFKANKQLFLSGRLKYDLDYPVSIGVQNLLNPKDKVDTSFTIKWYNTDVILPRIKPSVVGTVAVEEGYKLSFNVMCENGNFPIDKILFSSSETISNFKLPKECDDTFEWIPPYDFVTERDANKEKTVILYFVGTTKFNFSDTAQVKVTVKESLNYDIATSDYNEVVSNIKTWVLRLKYTFLQLDKGIRKTRGTRSTFDITSATSTVTGTIMSATNKDKAVGKVLPSAGVVLIPVKEAAAPTKTAEQNQATLVRSAIKRLEYVMFDTRLSGEKDPAISAKTETLKKELRQSQIQLAEVPTEMSESMSEKQLNDYFDSPKVQKKYRLK